MSHLSMIILSQGKTEKKISFVIPCYYSEKTIGTVCDDILRTMSGREFEIILVNDGSTDNTPIICDEIAKHEDFLISYH